MRRGDRGVIPVEIFYSQADLSGVRLTSLAGNYGKMHFRWFRPELLGSCSRAQGLPGTSAELLIHHAVFDRQRVLISCPQMASGLAADFRRHHALFSPISQKCFFLSSSSFDSIAKGGLGQDILGASGEGLKGNIQ